MAKYGSQERTRKQIKQDLNLDISDQALEQRLNKLRMADLIGRGSSFSRYKGLGDPVFEAVFRKAYGEEIEEVDIAEITEDLNQQMILQQRK